MKQNLDRFTFFRSYYESFEELSDRDRKAISLAIIEYIFKGTEPDFKGIQRSVWVILKPHLQVSINKSSNAKKNKSNKNQNKIKNKSNENQLYSIEEEEEIEEEIEVRSENKKVTDSVFSTPTLADIISYAESLEIKNTDYCEKFYNHYESVGWVNGAGNEIKNWKLVFKSWVKKDNLQKQSERVYLD